MAIALPLLGLTLLWLAALIAQFTDLYVADPWQSATGGYDVALESVHPSTYIMLLGISGLGIASVWAKSLAAAAEPSNLAKAAHGFTVIAVIASLIIGVIFGFAKFGSAFDSMQAGTQHNELVRIFDIYVPILLDAALLVLVILRAFVGHKEDTDE